MGYVNYIVIPKYKIAFVVSRNIDEYFEYELSYGEDELFVDFHDEIKNFKLNDLYNLMSYYKKVPRINYGGEALLVYVKSLNTPYEVISEYNFEEKDEYKDYLIIHKNYD